MIEPEITLTFTHSMQSPGDDINLTLRYLLLEDHFNNTSRLTAYIYQCQCQCTYFSNKLVYASHLSI